MVVPPGGEGGGHWACADATISTKRKDKFARRMSGFGRTLAGLCDGVSSIYATAASSYRQRQYQRPRGIDRMCPLRADQTYDGRTYANPDEMLKIAEISLRTSRHSPNGFPARIALLIGLDNGGSPLPRAKVRSRPPADVL